MYKIYSHGRNNSYKGIHFNEIEEGEALLNMFLRIPAKHKGLYNKHVHDLGKLNYYTNVWIATENNCCKIENINLRGADYHVDHIVPISYGFKIGIPEGLIGSKLNLNIKHRDHNMKKAAGLTDKAKELLTKWGYPVVSVDSFGNTR